MHVSVLNGPVPSFSARYFHGAKRDARQRIPANLVARVPVTIMAERVPTAAYLRREFAPRTCPARLHVGTCVRFRARAYVCTATLYTRVLQGTARVHRVSRILDAT